MKIFQKIILSISVLLFLITNVLTGQEKASFEAVETFYNYSEVLKQDSSITWGYLSVPEEWEGKRSRTIKIAVAVLKNHQQTENAPAAVFVQGGPGAGGIQNIWFWRNHALRKNHDIVLFDIRGTGFSKPRLCPELGKELLGVLAKNQSEEEDENQKINLVLSCKQELIKNGIAIDAYHSVSVAKDLHAILQHLGYKNWNVYATSYGTHMAQVYASMFTEDIKTLILDSSILDLATYYSKNTSNYMNSLKKVFEACENDLECNKEYPRLEETYYELIAEMEKNPITVDVEKRLVEEESFTFNSEDFKFAIQQALYNKQLVEVIPLLIYQFKEKNQKVLGNLVPAFATLIAMDYGVYYCVSCNEALPINDFSAYQLDVSQYEKLNGGLSFYKSDFSVCDKWNINKPDSLLKNYDLANLKNTSFPVLIFSGEYDPITPAPESEVVVRNFKDAYSIPAHTYGHIPGFTRIGSSMTTSFFNNPNLKPDMHAFKKAKKVEIVKDIAVNSGVSKMGGSLNEMNLLFIAPLGIAVGIMTAFIFVFLFLILRKKYKGGPDNIVRGLSIVSSILGLISLIGLFAALSEVSKTNFFILAFGLPQNYAYLITIGIVFLILVVLTLFIFVFSIKKITNRSIVFSVIFSNILLLTYMMYWGIISI